jgi:hypothetical protein
VGALSVAPARGSFPSKPFDPTAGAVGHILSALPGLRVTSGAVRECVAWTADFAVRVLTVSHHRQSARTRTVRLLRYGRNADRKRDGPRSLSAGGMWPMAPRALKNSRKGKGISRQGAKTQRTQTEQASHPLRVFAPWRLGVRLLIFQTFSGRGKTAILSAQNDAAPAWWSAKMSPDFPVNPPLSWPLTDLGQKLTLN